MKITSNMLPVILFIVGCSNAERHSEKIDNETKEFVKDVIEDEFIKTIGHIVLYKLKNHHYPATLKSLEYLLHATDHRYCYSLRDSVFQLDVAPILSENVEFDRVVYRNIIERICIFSNAFGDVQLDCKGSSIKNDIHRFCSMFYDSIALIELHKAVFGVYPHSVRDIVYSGKWSAGALLKMEYKKSSEGYEINYHPNSYVMNDLELDVPMEFWLGLGHVKSNLKH